MTPKAKRSASRPGLAESQLRRIALSFPGASEGTSYGKPAFLVGGKFFTRLRAEDDSVVLIVGSIDERDMLLENDPKLFHITEHYRNYPDVLARMALLDAATLRAMLERRWRAIAPRKLLRESDGPDDTKNRGESRKTGKQIRRRK
jgi:hypothetical protein